MGTRPKQHVVVCTVYPKKYAHGFCFAVLCCGYTLTDFPISIRLTSLALWQSNDCPSASKATLMNMDKYFMWIHYERLHNHNKAKHNKTVCIFLGIYCTCIVTSVIAVDGTLLSGARTSQLCVLGGRFKNAYELLNLRALKISMLYKNRIFQCMSKIFCVEFQRVPLKFHTKYLTHTLKDVNFIHRWNFKSS